MSRLPGFISGEARVQTQLVDCHGTTLNYVVDVFYREADYWGTAADCHLRHGVVRELS